MKPKTFLPILMLGSLFFSGTAHTEPRPHRFEERVIYRSGTEGYHTFRIPALITTKEGTLLAFAEGRKNSRSDRGEIHTVLRRSIDGGNTWGSIQVVAKDGENTFGNPCPVVDERTGRIWLLSTHNLGRDHEREIMDGTSQAPRTVWICHSDDDGNTWSEPENISAATREEHWRWYATGPGVGIQLRDGTLVIPANHSDHSDDGHPYRAHLIFSKDAGETWQMSKAVGEKTNESQVVERMDGSIMTNMRSYHEERARAVAVTEDLGRTWSPIELDHSLVDPVCQASLLRYSGFGPGEASLLLFANPAAVKRENMTVRMSYDEGRTWPISRQVFRGPSAYSSLARLADGRIGLLYEKGADGPYETITLAVFERAWLEGE